MTHADRAVAELDDSADVLPNQSAPRRTAPDRLGRPSPPHPGDQGECDSDVPSRTDRMTRTRLKTGSPKGRVGCGVAPDSRDLSCQDRYQSPRDIECMRGRSGLRRARPSWWRAARWGPDLPVDDTRMLARVNGVPDDQIGLAQADCCRFAARGGRFVGGRGRRGPLTWGGAEGI